MASVKLNWSSAEVKDAKLNVGLEGEFSDEWKNSFKTTVALLDQGEWGAVKLKKGTVRVSDVGAGTEEKLRFFLESAVTQANASDAPDADDEERSTDDGEQDEEPENSQDAEMTERFRGFGSEEPESAESSESARG